MTKPIKALCILLLLFSGSFAVYASKSPELKSAVELAKSGKQSEAIAAIKKLIDRDPGPASLEAHLSLGIIYFKSRQYDSSLGEFDLAVALSKDTPMAYYFRGLIYEKKAKNSGVTARQAAEFKKAALAQWQAFLETAARVPPVSETRSHNGITRAQSIERARQHIKVLTEELEHEKN